MSDYAGAVAAIQDVVATEFTEIPTTLQNNGQFTPPVDGNGAPTAFGHLEVLNTVTEIIGTGTPNTYAYLGVIFYHVFVPVGYGTAEALRLAVAVGELFRARVIYDNGDGCFVRTVAPGVMGGGTPDDMGNWFRQSMTVDYTYYHLA